MKKHYIIIGVVLVSALFFIPAIIKRFNDAGTGTEQSADPSTLNERIGKIGQNPWDEKLYKSLSSEISGLASAQQISASERNNYRSTLNINMQRALALSFKTSMEESCYTDNVDALLRSSDTISNPIAELSKQRSTYTRFKNVLKFSRKLNALLSKQYDDNAATTLKRDYQSAYANEPFRNCASIKNLKNEIDQKTTSFKNFVADYKIKIKSADPDFDYYNDNDHLLAQLKKYSFYYKEFISLQQ